MIITARDEVAKVMFLHLCVCTRGEGEYLGRYPPGGYPRQVHTPGRYPLPGRCPPAGTPIGKYIPPAGTPSGQVHPLGRYTHPPSRYTPGRYTPTTDGYCCRWYASYWNAFLLKNKSQYVITFNREFSIVANFMES